MHDDSKPDKRYSSRLSLLFLCVLLLTVATVEAAKNKGGPRVVVGTVSQATIIDEVPLTGTVISPRLAKLSTEVSGLVKAINVDIGSRVKPGEILLELDDELGELEFKAAQAENEVARQKLADTRRRMVDAQRLIERKTVSQNELYSLEAEVKIDQAAMQRTLAEQKRQQVRLNKHRLVAPYEGVISRKYVEQGEWVQPGDAVLELVATESLHIDFQLPEVVYSKVQFSSKISVRFEAIPGRLFEGKIKAIVPMSDASARTMLLRVSVQDDIGIAHGMSASGTLRIPAQGKGLVVPRDAILRYPDGRISVWIIEGQGDGSTVKEQLVKTGLSFDGMVSIQEGLEAGMRVVLEGNESLRSGQNVIIHSSR